MEVKYFDHLISLGLNCEIAHQIRINHGNIESNLLTWAAMRSDKLKLVLNNYALIFSENIRHDPATNMFFCSVTGCGFHGRKPPAELLDDHGKIRPELATSEKEECISRVKHLCQKDSALTRDESKKLYVLGVHPQFLDCHLKQATAFVTDIYQLLMQNANNAALLAIVDKATMFHLAILENEIAMPKLYLRSIAHFAPFDKAVYNEYSDVPGYHNIFSEFLPKNLTCSAKKFKYD